MAIEPRIIDNGQGVKIIDPNPPYQVVEHEDLYIYASLVAKTKGRSFLTEDAKGNTTQENINISTVDMVVSDTATDNGKKRQFLTTAWSDIGGSQLDDAGTRGDVEGFGITNIDIEIKGSYIPRVVIDFVDIRGATLFEQGSCSPYGMFFHLPYPVFELTLKGYYGKPATYFLNLQKFNTKFNTETGNFECKAEFIGWSYAFLADILMGYVRCSNFMKGSWGAKESLRKKYDEAVTYYLDNGIFDEGDYQALADSVNIQGVPRYEGKLQPFCKKVAGTDTVECRTISSLLQDIQQIKTFLGQVKGDDDYLEVANLIRTKNEVIRMREAVTNFARKLEQDFKGYLDGEPRITKAKNPDGTARKIKELYVFNQSPDEKLKDLLSITWARPINDGSGGDLPGSGFGDITVNIPTIKEGLIKDDFNSGQKTCGGSYVAVASNKADGNDGKTKCQRIEVPLKFQLLDFLDDITGFQKGMLISNDTDIGILRYKDTNNIDNDDFYIDIGYLTSILDGDLEILSNEIESKRNSVKEAIDDGVIKVLGFRPTVRNVFTILSCNVENFVQLLLDVCIKAEKHHTELEEQYNEQYSGGEEDQFMILNKKSKGDPPKKIYPWPTYYQTQYKSTAQYNAGSDNTETKEVYPGVNQEFNDWPEVRFVEDFIDACTKLNEADEDLLEEKESRPGYDNYMPINPLESKIYGETQLKYREILKSDLEPRTLKDAVNTIIAERMFVTLDFSYFDPIRYNQFNLGLGYTYNPGATGNDGSVSDYERWNKQRIWFQTLYKTIDKQDEDKGKPGSVLTNLARIDAHNLMSCITDVNKLQVLDNQIFNNTNSLKDQIEELLKGKTENKTEPTGDTNKPWFNPDAKYTDLSTNISPAKILEDNVAGERLDNFDENSGYWAYYPPKGYIRLLGSGSAGSIGREDNPALQRVECDIRKMDQQYLFQLIDDNEFNPILSTGVDLDYIGKEKIIERRKNLEDSLFANTQLAATDRGPNKKITKYKVNEETKLIMFDGADTEGSRMFTSLGINVGKKDNGGIVRPFDIKYSAIPVYCCNDKAAFGTALCSSWGADGAKNYPFANQQYRWANYDRTVTGNILDSTVPARTHTLEVAGRGIFKTVEIYDYAGKNGYSSASNSPPKDVKNYTTLADDEVSKGDRTKWSNTSVLDGLTQLPIWSDNVNRFREATSKEGFNISFNGSSKTSRLSNADWGYKRPLTTTEGDVKYYGLKGPKLDEIKTKFGANNSGEYTKKEIESRNLAYLYLASCKPTPFITNGLAASTKNSGDGFFGGNLFDATEEGTYNYIGDHYPKALEPFINSQGIIKIPKLWVYGMGSVMWRWKMFMGVNRTTDGNIVWRNPAFKHEPKGLDPLAQPGHPGVACDGKGSPLQGGAKIFSVNFTGRKNRSTTEDGSTVLNATESYANKLFKTEKGLWSSPIETKDQVQISSFSRGVTRIQGVGRATMAGAYNSSLPPGGQNNIVTGGGKKSIVQYVYEDQPVIGSMFDWWGVYANDINLTNGNKILPMSWIPKEADIKPNVSNGETAENIGVWNSWMKNFIYSVGPTIREPAIWDGGDEEMSDYYDNSGKKYNAIELQMRSAKEASSNSYWPMLWIAPWQHFYTEVINTNGNLGTKRSNDALNTGVEQVLTFIPMDHMFRDYSGNFGYLGSKNGNYAARAVGATEISFDSEIPLSFINLSLRKPITQEEYTFTTFNVTITNSGDGTKGESALLTKEGGKYNELMALLPTFVKERFVEEFEEWCDDDWRNIYLKIIDPVNFGGDGADKLAESYRINGFNNSTWTFSDIIGKINADSFVDPTPIDGDLEGFGVIGLDKETQGVRNKDEIEALKNNLVDSFYYAVIPTPRLFGLDVWNGDKSEEVNGMSKNAFYANKDLAEKYLNAFKAEWKSGYVTKREELTLDPTKNDDGSVLNDDDIKLALYRSFKSICDKWISSSTNVKDGKPSYFFNITDSSVVTESMGTSHVPLAGHFSYVNRAMQEIGNKSVLDVARLDKIPENPKMSFYNLISDLLGENNFDFFPLPTYTNFTADKSNENLKSMFRPDTNSIAKASGPNFICMYVGGTSRTVDLKSNGSNCPADNKDMSYNDDGFSITKDQKNSYPKPYEMENPKQPLKKFEEKTQDSQLSPGRIEGNGFTAFRVAYGVENQNMFKSVELDQAEFSETNESLLVINRLANGGNPGNKTNKGQNLHNLYLTRSYTCTVQSMGNMMIQPLQYFELTNIPMFYGTYLITEVKHNVKPHHIGTTFKGVRQPLATVPIVEDISTAMSLTLKDIKPIGGSNVINSGSGGGTGGGSGGGSYATSSISVSNVSASNGFYVQQSDGDLYVVSDRLGVAGTTLLEFTRDLEKYLQNKFPDREYKFSNDNGAGPNITRSLQKTLAGGKGRIKTSKHGSGFAIDMLFEGKFKNFDTGDISELGNYYNTPKKKKGGTDTRTGYGWPKGNLVVVKDHDYMNAIKEYLETSKWKDIIKWGATWGGDYTKSGREKIAGIENSTLNFKDGAIQNDELHHFEIKSGIMAKYWTQEQKDFIESIGLKVPNKQSELAAIYKYPFDNPSVLTDDTFQDKGDGEPSSNVVPVPSNFDDTQPIGKGIEGKNITSAGSVQNALQYAGQI